MIRAVIFDMFETLVTHYKAPLYFSAEMAEDAGVSVEEFRTAWYPTEESRSIGKYTLEESLEIALKECGCYSEELLQKIVTKRKAAKKACFNNLHEEIIPMLAQLKEKGILIGLISNCFSEETDVIRSSELFPYFDVPCMSYEEGVQKPDVEIFRRCMERLGVKAEECLYVGDGGSRELETASSLGMKAVQAAWYLKEGTSQPSGRKKEFKQMETPLEVVGEALKESR